MKILFWVPYPTEGPSNRFRVEQYLPFLEEKGFSCQLRPFWEGRAYKILYEKGCYFRKIYYFLKGGLSRIRDLFNLSDYDLVFIHREAFPIGGSFLENIVSKNKPIIYDFDDSIFLPNSSGANRIAQLLKNPHKIAQIIKISSVVIAGNNYLSKYAIQYNKNVVVIPTSIDTKKYLLSGDKNNGKKIVIGWMGTYSTNQYLRILNNVFKRLIEKYGNLIEIRLVGCRNSLLNIPGIVYKSWSLSTEPSELASFDIGLMPIWEDDWTRGKCAFKIIQYMACGAAVVASPVGMNKEIVIDGENGFLAKDDEEWLRKVSLLIENKELRKKFSLKARQNVEREFSTEIMQKKFINIFEGVYEHTKK